MNLNFRKPLFFTFLIFSSVLIGCKSKAKINADFNYFQKGADSATVLKYEFKEQPLRINDIITIQIIAGSIDQRDAVPFNLVNSAAGTNASSTVVGVSSSGSINGSQFQIDETGFIEFPKIGKVRVAGLTKRQLEEELKTKLLDEIKNPMVVVKLSQFKINVLGEVKRPGVTTIKGDKANILEGLAEAGDLTDAGRRDSILVLRENDGKYETYRIDLRNTNFINSPAFQLHQNDVIYVSANSLKLRALAIQDQTFFQKNGPLILSSISTLAILINAFGWFR